MNLTQCNQTSTLSDMATTMTHRTARPWAAARQVLRTHRSAFEARRKLDMELAGYTTHAERMELNAILARNSPAAVNTLSATIRHRLI